jgi:hypothetical protein
MSGTGNTYRMACWIKEFAGPYMEEIKIVMIDAAGAGNEPIPSRNTLVGVLFPTHGFMPPWSMIKFLLRMGRQNRVAAICAATRGMIKVGPLHIPGVSGLGTFLAAFLMLLKGYRPRALFSLDMPSNFINFHWGLHAHRQGETETGPTGARHHAGATRIFYAQQPVGGFVGHRYLLAVSDIPHHLSSDRETLHGKGDVFQ